MADKPVTDYEHWQAQLDADRPQWWIELANEQELRACAQALFSPFVESNSDELARRERMLRSSVSGRLWLTVRAWTGCEAGQRPYRQAREAADRESRLRFPDTTGS